MDVQICGRDVVIILLAPWVTLALVAQVLGDWMLLMVGLSVITTLYGHYAEGRPLR